VIALWLGLGAVLMLIRPPSSAQLRVCNFAGPRPRAAGGRWRGLVVSASVLLDQSGRRPVLRLGILVACGAAAGAVGGRLAVGLAIGLLLAVVALTLTDVMGERRSSQRHRDLRAAVSLLSDELAAGSREDAALAAAAQVAGHYRVHLARAAAEASVGADVSIGLSGGPLAVLGTVWRVRRECGAGLADVLASVGADLALADARRREVGAVLAGPRSSAALLAGLPVIGIVMGIGMGADPLRFLFATRSGSLILLLGVGLDVAGLMWTRCLTSQVRR
jgi:tight adherence protein B